MTSDEVERIAVEWAAKEGWNPGIYDAPCFYGTDPKGFFAGFFGEEPIACISAVAYDPDLANKLFLASSNHVKPGTTLYLDTPAMNEASVQLAERHGMKKVFETARMYTKSQPDIDLNKIYGVTTFELG